MKPSESSAAVPLKRRKLIVLLAIVVLASMALFAYLIGFGYRDTLAEARAESRNYAAIIEARLDATLRRADAILLARVRATPPELLSKQALARHGHRLDAELDDSLIQFPELASVRIFDADGDLLYTSGRAGNPRRVNIADRDHFRHLRDDSHADRVFSGIVISRFSDKPAQFFGRAIRDRQGVFRGAVFVGLDLEHMQKLFRTLQIGAHGVVSIYRSDVFTPVVRWPEIAGSFDKPLPPGIPTRAAIESGAKTGTVELLAASDGVRRLYSFHVVEGYPFYVTVGLATEDALAGWRSRTLAAGLSGLLLLGMVAGLLLRLWRVEASEKQALRDLDMRIEEERKSAAENMRIQKRMTGLLDIAPDAIIAADAANRIIVFNKSAEAIFGYAASEMIGMPLERLLPARFAESHRAHVQAFAREAVPVRDMGSNRPGLVGLRKNGSEFPAQASISVLKEESGPVSFAVVRDITDRRRAEQQLEYRATHDSLTGLPNRALFIDRLTHAIDIAEREEKLAALLFIDLDGFKQANDAYGHARGDDLLRGIAQRLLETLRRSDTAARIGGDEFAVILEQVGHVDMVSAIAQKIIDRVREPFVFAQGEITVSASIGITICPFDAKTVDDLMVDADRAMYAAKSSGKNRFEYYSHRLAGTGQAGGAV